MSDDDGFLARWSRRKRRAAVDDGATATEAATPSAETPAAPAAGPAAPETEAAVDPASLPPIDSIAADSDMQPFLQAGVPTEVTRMALRRAWSADPAIRDFVGLSENSWDFNAPGGAPGFGVLTSEEARRLLAQMTEPQDEAAPAEPAASAAAEEPASDTPETEAAEAVTQSLPQREKVDNALQQNPREEQPASPVQRRSHGGALPQ